MAPTTVADALGQVGDQPDPAEAFKTILANIKTLSAPDRIAEDLSAVIDAALGAGMGVPATKAVATAFVATLEALDNYDLWIEAGTHAVGAISRSGTVLSSALLDSAAQLRGLVATAQEAQEDFAAAARTLMDIPLDSAQRRAGEAERARVWVRVVRNLLEADDATQAEAYVNKLRGVMHAIPPTDDLQLHFRLSAARVQDAKRQFLAAAQSYYEISLAPAIAEDERLHTLSMAIKCAVLAPAGPPRSRVLARLYKDERAAGLPEYGILEKMFLDRLLAPREVEQFAQGLAPHQLATTADGSTVLARAVVEHNLLGASRLYRNIGFDQLGVLLGLDGARAEDTTAKMIEQGRLAGWIDQIDRVICFADGGDTSASAAATAAAAAAVAASTEKSAASASAAGGGSSSASAASGHAAVSANKEMRRWDANVQAVAEYVEQLTNALQAEFPDFVASQIAV